MSLTIEAADGRHFAVLEPLPEDARDTVRVVIWQRISKSVYVESPARRLHEMTLDCPWHVARDRVHDILHSGVDLAGVASR